MLRSSHGILAAIILSAGLAACSTAGPTDLTSQLFGDSTEPAPVESTASTKKPSELLGKVVAPNLDEADRQKLEEATARVALTGEKQTFTSSKGEKIVAQKKGKPEVVAAAEGGQKKKCQKIEQQIVKTGGKIDRDVVEVCGDVA
jgi:hypothetical protein